MLLNKLFLGQFAFHRHVYDPQINLYGTANIETNDGRITYRENGQYSLAGKLQIFYQNRLIIVEEGRLCIYKEDHSLLHEFFISGKNAFPLELTHKHLCGDDQYFLTMTIESYKSFSTSYVVTGPAKNYIIQTDYKRT